MGLLCFALCFLDPSKRLGRLCHDLQDELEHKLQVARPLAAAGGRLLMRIPRTSVCHLEDRTMVENVRGLVL